MNQVDCMLLLLITPLRPSINPFGEKQERQTEKRKDREKGRETRGRKEGERGRGTKRQTNKEID